MLRGAVAGLGFGSAVHLPVLKSFGDVEIVGIAGARDDKVSTISREFGIPQTTTDPSHLVDLDLDFVSVALPPGPTGRLINTALSNDLPVLTEKPIARTFEEALTVLRLAGSIPTAVDFEFAELTSFRRFIESCKEIGELYSVDIEWFSNSWALRHKVRTWKLDAHAGGGVLNLFGSHLFFMIEQAFGLIESLEAEASNEVTAKVALWTSTPAWDTARCSLRTERVPRIDLSISNAGPAHRHTWFARGSDGTVRFENATDSYINGFRLRVVRGHRDDVYEQPVVPGRDDRSEPFSRLARRFLNAVRENNATAATPGLRAGVRTQQLIDAAEEAISGGDRVKIASNVDGL